MTAACIHSTSVGVSACAGEFWMQSDANSTVSNMLDVVELASDFVQNGNVNIIV